jgi:hypothetical protein
VIQSPFSRSIFSFSIHLAILIGAAMTRQPIAHAGALSVSAGGSYELYSYREHLTAPQKSTETAYVPSAIVSAQWYLGDGQDSRRSYLRFRYETCRSIASTYDGSDLSTSAPVTATNLLAFDTIEAAVYLPLSASFGGYVGYGYRIWNRLLAGTPGYREIYRWYYMPLGLQWWWSKTGIMDFGVDISVRPTSRGVIEVITSQTFPNGKDSSMDLGAKTGYRIAFPIRNFFNPWMIELTPWYERSEIGQSNSVANSTLGGAQEIFEPASTTDRFGADFLLSYYF